MARPRELDVIYHQDARDMHQVPDGSVALVVTSPPYFAGKEYEEVLGRDGVPATYFEYLAMLRSVFAECKRVLEPGGRIAVNVANLGRRPYRSLAGDVTEILQELGFLLRGEVVWWKGRAAGGSCAWGSFQSPRNPVLRDVTERVVIASHGRFDRALEPVQRARAGLPSRATITRDEFLEATTDLWELAAESAARVGHPAPFPVELPRRLIELYTFEGDVVLDPFMGSGSAAVAAVRCGRRYLGFDTDASYVLRAGERVARVRREAGLADGLGVASDLPAAVAVARSEGRQAKEIAALLLASCGFVTIRRDVKVARLGVEIPLSAKDASGREWRFDLVGALTTGDAGLRRGDAVWRAIGRAAVLADGTPHVILTTAIPSSASAAGRALAQVQGPAGLVTDVIGLEDPDGHRRLATYSVGERPT